MLITEWYKTVSPLDEFRDFQFVSWEKDIYPKYKGVPNPKEVDFLCNLITSHNLKKVVDFAVGGGIELSNILNSLKERHYQLDAVEANEVDDQFIDQANEVFVRGGDKVLIHKADWSSISNALPPYATQFDFGFLIGNSLTYVGGLTRQENKKAQADTIHKLGQLIQSSGYFFLDTRDYNYIADISSNSLNQLREKFTFQPTIYYHGAQKEILILSVYIDDVRVCFHYYDIAEKKWSFLQLFRVYHEEIIEALSEQFSVEKVYYDFHEKKKDRNVLIQYLAKRQ